MSPRFVFLDRDGTVIVQKHHLRSIVELELIPGAADGIRRLNAAGIGVLILTNQSVVGRGLLTRDGLEEIHAELLRRLAANGARVDGIYVCPHAPEEGCACRKPGVALARRAAEDHGFDLDCAFVIGDQTGDVALAHALSATSILVRTGYGKDYRGSLAPDFVAEDLAQAAERIICMSELVPNALARVRNHIEASIETKRKLLDSAAGPILEAARLLAECFAQGGKVMLCGNGGSAADAQHLAAEFVSVLTQDFLRPGLPAIALTTDSSILTAYANDFGFAGVFERQVQALGRPGDVLIGISTSGNSQNVLAAVNYARSRGIKTIVLTGAGGGKLGPAADVAICAPSTVTQFIQESHICIGHILCDLAEHSLEYDRDGVVSRAAPPVTSKP